MSCRDTTWLQIPREVDGVVTYEAGRHGLLGLVKIDDGCSPGQNALHAAQQHSKFNCNIRCPSKALCTAHKVVLDI